MNMKESVRGYFDAIEEAPEAGGASQAAESTSEESAEAALTDTLRELEARVSELQDEIDSRDARYQAILDQLRSLMGEGENSLPEGEGTQESEGGQGGEQAGGRVVSDPVRTDEEHLGSSEQAADAQERSAETLESTDPSLSGLVALQSEYAQLLAEQIVAIRVELGEIEESESEAHTLELVEREIASLKDTLTDLKKIRDKRTSGTRKRQPSISPPDGENASGDDEGEFVESASAISGSDPDKARKIIRNLFAGRYVDEE